jgi:hypothetical protein
MPTNIPEPPLDAIRSNIDWCEGDAVLRVRENLEVTPTEMGPWPRVIRTTDWNRVLSDKPEPAQGQYMVAESEMPLDGPVPVSPTGPRPEAPPEPVPEARTAMEALLAQPAPEAPPEAPEPPQEPDRYLWTIITDDESDSFVAVRTEAATGHGAERVERFQELKDVTAFMKTLGATRLPDSPEAGDEVFAVFSSPE